MSKAKGALRHKRGTTNRNDRGSCYDRQARKRWLLKSWDADLGTDACRCADCGEVLAYDTVQADRIVPGALGGRYTRDNIQPMCGPCNIRWGNVLRDWLAAMTTAAGLPSSEDWATYAKRLKAGDI